MITKEFVEKYNELARLCDERNNLLKDKLNRIESKTHLRIQTLDLSKDVHFIATGILEKLKEEKKFNWVKDRLPNKTLLKIYNNELHRRIYRHKSFDTIDWFNSYGGFKEEIEQMPEPFVKMLNELKEEIESYHKKAKEIFEEEREQTHYWSRKRHKDVVLVEKKVNIKANYRNIYSDGTELKPIKIDRVKLIANNSGSSDSIKFTIKIGKQKKEGMDVIERENLSIATNEEVWQEIILLMDKMDEYINSWEEKQKEVWKKINKIIEEHGYLNYVALGRL